MTHPHPQGRTTAESDNREEASTDSRYAAAKARRDELAQMERYAAAQLRMIPGINSGPLGLTPDAVKASPAYRAARAAHGLAFRRLQDFNASFCPEFRAEIVARRAPLQAEKD